MTFFYIALLLASFSINAHAEDDNLYEALRSLLSEIESQQAYTPPRRRLLLPEPAPAPRRSRLEFVYDETGEVRLIAPRHRVLLPPQTIQYTYDTTCANLPTADEEVDCLNRSYDRNTLGEPTPTPTPTAVPVATTPSPAPVASQAPVSPFNGPSCYRMGGAGIFQNGKGASCTTCPKMIQLQCPGATMDTFYTSPALPERSDHGGNRFDDWCQGCPG